MTSDRSIREQGYIYFLQEAPELLQVIEQDLLTLLEDRSIAKVHSLMRATHTLKGSAANVGLEAINAIAHSLEDIVKTLYNPDLAVDTELQTLLLEAYDCLREPLTAEIQGFTLDNDELIQRSNQIFAQLQDKLGDFFGEQAHIPSSVELGFDVVESVFEMGVKQRLDGIAAALKQDEESLKNCLRSEVDVFIGLAESLNLPGFAEIAQTTLTALEAHPEQVQQIATIALADFTRAREEILAGDRTVGGTPSLGLQQLAQNQPSPEVLGLQSQNLDTELDQFYDFITSDKQELTPQEVQFYLKVTRYCLDWFHQVQSIPEESLSLSLLVPQLHQENQSVDLQEAKLAVRYVEDWIDNFIDSVKSENDTISLSLYRHGAILTVVLALAKFIYQHQTQDVEKYSDIPLIQLLRRRRNKVIQAYKKHPPLRKEDKKVLQRLQPSKLSAQTEATSPKEFLLEEIWGEPNSIQVSTPVAVIPMTQTVDVNTVNSANSRQKIEPQKIQSSNKENVHSPFTHQSVRVDLEELERLNYLVGNLLINQNRQLSQEEQLQEVVQDLRSTLKRHQQTLNQLRDWSNLMASASDNRLLALQSYPSGRVENAFLSQVQASKLQQAPFDSLELDSYTDLYNLFNTALEETLQLNGITDIIDQISKQLGYTLEKHQTLLSHVRNDMTAVQMLPVGEVLGRFPRMIQQLAAAKNKPVELKVSGGEVLVDKAIAEKLYDPLLHLVRNAFDHGIESIEVRRQRGKLDEGKIEIRAYHQGDRTIIEVRDDGKGLDFEAIRHRAVDLNFVTSEQAPQLSKAQLLDLLFEPGFSTRETASDLSGRGIGLDVVRNQLENLKGSITVESQPQMGTTFSLQIPFSLTSAKFFVCEVGGVNYALLSDSIAKIVLPQPEQIKLIEGKKRLIYGLSSDLEKDNETDVRAIPIYQLSELIQYNESLAWRSREQETKASPDTINQLFLVRGNTGLFALEVDRILGEQELVIRPLGSAIAAPSYIFGCSILGDGGLILAVDGAILLDQTVTPHSLPEVRVHLPALSASPMLGTPNPSVKELPAANSANSKTVLVVDDSMSYRQTLALNLQQAGYQVEQAQDGAEALQKLREVQKIGLVICDIEMPRMNGFEFLKHCQQDLELKKIPVVMLTSRSSEKHRLLASELGAAAYLTKPYLESELLSTVAQLEAQRK